MFHIFSFKFCLLLSFILYFFNIFRRRRNRTLVLNQNYITKDTTVLITGGCIGIGLEIIKLLFEKTKCRIINIDIREDCFSQLCEIAKANNCFIENHKCDLSNLDNLNTIIKKITDKYSKIDFLINNAAVSFNKEFLNLSEEEIIKTTNVNLVSPSLICKKIIPVMLKNNFGHVVSIASVLSHVTTSMAPDYVMTKWGLYGFHESLRFNFMRNQRNSINFTIICPYTINTGMFKGFKSPLPLYIQLKISMKILEPTDVAQRIYEAIILKENVVYIQGFQKYIIMLAKILPASIYDFLHLNIIERKKQIIETREDNYKLLNINNFKSS